MTAEEIINDQHWNEGYDAAKKKIARKVSTNIHRTNYVMQTLLSAGTDEEDECILTLKKIITSLSEIK